MKDVFGVMQEKFVDFLKKTAKIKEMRISIIGTGNMGGAIAHGLVNKQICNANDITCTAKHIESLEALSEMIPQINTTLNNAAACSNAEIIILSVKPWQIEEVIKEIRDFILPSTLIISIVAGVTFSQLDSLLQKRYSLFRVIPNTAIMLSQSMTFIAAQHANEEDTEKVIEIFNELGEVLLVEENQMAAGTALASCGIAFAMKYIESSTKGGVELGFDNLTAKEIVLNTIKGAIAVLENSPYETIDEIQRVTTPGGITERGLNAMEKENFSTSVIDGLKACL